MMITNAEAAPKFDLKQPSYYFSDKRTLVLLAAAMSGDIHSAQVAVATGANPNDEGPLSNKYNRLRPLHYAIAANNKKAVRLLISVGADPELSALGFGRAILFAMTLKNMEMISLLLDIRPISSLSKDTMEYILFEAVGQPCRDCLKLFLERGAPIDYPDEVGYTVMMSAMDCQDYDMAEWLLNLGHQFM